ncbi:MAG: tRNA-binding protein [Spirochaetaceae bacterium]|nr:MAG: tRNA-binding protein [Spirochaetaceae bacterium]
MATYEEFMNIEIRVGRVVRAEHFAAARKPAVKMWIDFGEMGILTSSAQITRRYAAEGLVGGQVLAVTNFPPRTIAGFSSQVLVLGAVPEEGDVVLVRPDLEVVPGTRVL